MTLTKKEILAKRAKYFPWIGNGMGYHCASFCMCDDAYADPNGWPWYYAGGAIAGVMTHPICHSGLHLPGFTYPCLYFAQDANTTPIYPVLDGVLCVGSRVFDLLNPNDYGVNKDGVGIVKPQLYGWVDDDGRYWSMGGGIRKVEHLPDIVIYPDYPYLPYTEYSTTSEAVCYLTRDEWNQYGIEATNVEWGASEIAFDYISPSYLDKIKEEPELALEQGYFCCGTAYPLAWVLDDYTNTVTPSYTKTGVNGFHRNGIYPNTLPNINYGFNGLGVFISRGIITPDIEIGAIQSPSIVVSSDSDKVELNTGGIKVVYTVWQIETDEGWRTLESAVELTSPNFTPGTYTIRCIALGGGSTYITEPIELTVENRAIISIGCSSKDVKVGETVTFTSSVTKPTTYQWQISSDEKTWVNVSTSDKFATSWESAGTYYVRCVSGSGIYTDISRTLEINVIPRVEDIEAVLAFEDFEDYGGGGDLTLSMTYPGEPQICYEISYSAETLQDFEECDLDDWGECYGQSVVFSLYPFHEQYHGAYRICLTYEDGDVYSNVLFVVLTWDEDWCYVIGTSSESLEGAYADAEAKGGVYREY